MAKVDSVEGAPTVMAGISHGAGREARRQFVTGALLVIAVASAATGLALVSAQTLGVRAGVSGRMANPPARQTTQKLMAQQLWFSPGIQDQLNRQVRIGQRTSGRLRGLINAGLNAQARMVHLDSFHDNEVKMAARETDAWSAMGGDSNGGNEPCMDAVGDCP